MKIVFDIGGTNTRIANIVDGKVGEILKMPTPQNVESAKAELIQAIRNLAGKEEIESIVGGVAGIIKNGVISNSPNLSTWNGFDLKKILQENFCHRVEIYNDADLAGLGEALYGAGKGQSIVGYICVGTGVGGGRIVNGKIDANNSGFEPGHHILDIARDRTFEDIVSGRAILEKYKKPAEEVGQVEIQKLIPALARGLYNAALFWSPDVLVLGGSLLNEETAYKIEDIKKALQEIKVQKILPQIRKAELGDDSGLWGALAMMER